MRGDPDAEGRTILVAGRRRGPADLVLIVVPVTVFALLLGLAIVDAGGDYAFDFRQSWQGARDAVEGVSPYPSRELLETADDTLGPAGIQEVFRFPYPAFTAVVLAPFGLLPFELAAALWTVALIAASVASLRIVGSRDVRLIALALGTASLSGAIRLGTLTPILMLLVALAWRWRDRRWLCAAALAPAVALKLFLWPLLVWLVATRRYRAAAGSTVGIAALLGCGWAVIGLDGLSLYPDLVRSLARVVDQKGYSLVALGELIGLPGGVARALQVLVGATVLAVALWYARRRPADDPAAFSVVIFAALITTPIVWLHYFALLLVPLAIARPTLDRAWALPMLFWLVPTQENGGEAWRVVVALGLATSMVVATGHPRPRRQPAIV